MATEVRLGQKRSPTYDMILMNERQRLDHPLSEEVLMASLHPIFHMDDAYLWRWYITDTHGQLLCMSDSFFFYVEAQRDYERACIRMQL